ncbi:MAG: glycoside hydrolase [Phycisphaeraceae bacterium]|nr:glycoside hydrolase [Phycisphaeraceae bacterium]
MTLTLQQDRNLLGMRLLPIMPGIFDMGQADGDPDERPVHRVEITKPFYMAQTPVTNAQYEQFDPKHKALRGIHGFSTEDDDAVVNVSWEEAQAFCRWLTEKEDMPYRLPTEAQWEYACRAGSVTQYHTGETLPDIYHRHQVLEWEPKKEWNLKPVSLQVGTTPSNAWGLCDMHGLVEEWCEDWYGPYPDETQIDPIGYIGADARVTRGGSHNTPLWFLRSANRSAAIPQDKHWRIGFRVVVCKSSNTTILPKLKPPRCMQAVRQSTHDWSASRIDTPFFKTPLSFLINPPRTDDQPLKPFNHCPAITWCDNGDLLAAWFSTVKEEDRQMIIMASRYRQQEACWEPASLFFDIADRNHTGTALFNNGQGKLFHFNGVETGETWAALALAMRTSTDNGATWSAPTLINPNHQPRNQAIASTMMTREGHIIQPCDAVHHACGGTAIHISRDGGKTWQDPTAGSDKPDYTQGNAGPCIAGIHASLVQLNDGRFLALGRGNSRLGRDDNIEESSPMSLSNDWGKTWTYHASPFGVINSGQRSVLMRLHQGPLLVVTFTDPKTALENPTGRLFPTSDGRCYRGYGMYAALSYDDGQTWPTQKLLTASQSTQTFHGGGWTREFIMDQTHAEPRGYLAATQTPDDTIHLISSGLHYQFNLAWLEQPANWQ